MAGQSFGKKANFAPTQNLPKKKSAGKRILFFLPALLKKGEAGSERRQRKTAEGWLKSEHRDCGWVGRRFGFSARQKHLLLWLRAEADETEQKINPFLKNLFGAPLKTDFLRGRGRKDAFLPCRQEGRRKPNRKD